MKLFSLSRIVPIALIALFVMGGSAVADQQYSVRKGDTLAAIARKTGSTVNAIQKANHIKGGKLSIDQSLIIPSSAEERKKADSSATKAEISRSKAKSASSKDDSSTRKSTTSSKQKKEIYTVKKGDTLSRISSKTKLSVDQLRKLNNLSSNRLKTGQKLVLTKKTAPACMVEDEPSEQAVEKLADGGRHIADTEMADVSDEPTIGESFVIDDEKRKLLGEWNSPEEPQLLVKVALAFLDAPYRLGGSSVRGIDCSGFVKKIYSLFGINLPRTASEQSHTGVEVAKSSLTEGDLLFFHSKNRIGHVGIYIGGNKFVHAASSNKGVRVDSLDSAYYKSHFKRAVRLKSKEDNT
jgi:cell wall-associated NlpC family hydrolase